MQPILDYILDHAVDDERPYLKVKVFGLEILGLLDSGASRTIIGSTGWKLIQSLGFLIDSSKRTNCRVANGQICDVSGECLIPFCVRDKLRVISVLIVPDVPHALILGADFWKIMGVVPDLRHNEWHFSDTPAVLNVVDHLRSQTVLTELQKVRLEALVDRNRELMGTNLGCTDVAEHVIVCNAAPIKQRYYPVSPVMQAHIDRELDEMLNMGVIEKSKSPWSSPILMVKKKDGKLRFCVDYRKLNAVTERDSYPLPYISHTLDKLRNAHYLSTLDIKSAYWQVPVAEASRPFTAFTVPGRGLFQFNRMPFGLHNAPATWQRLIDTVLDAELLPYVFTYLDDVVIVTDTFEKHLNILGQVFDRLRNAKLTVSWEKCEFCRPELKYLGYVIDRNGLHVDPDKVNAMLAIPTPTSVKDVRSILGTFSWYRRFVPNFSTIASPLSSLLKKGRKFSWTPECEQSFQKIKECLVSAPVLHCPDYELPFVVQCDASGYGLGAVLLNEHPDGDRVICYLSRSLSKQERNFSTTERECLAVLWSIETLRPYLDLIPFTVITDHYSLVWLQNLKDPTGRLARWAVRLQQYNFKIIHRKGKEHVVPDCLSRSVPLIDLVDVVIRDRWYDSMLEKVSQNSLKFSQWRVCDGKLFKFVKSSFAPLSEEVDYWKEVVPKPKRNIVIGQFHDPPLAGHLGVLKTYKRVCEKFYWPKLKSDVARYIRNCLKCAEHKVDFGGPRGHMTPQPKATSPFEIVATDLMGPFPRSTSGHKFILVVTDLFSKFSLTFPLRSATSKLVTNRIEEGVFLIFGVPRLLICDNGTQYTSKLFSDLMKQYGVTVRYNALYHPQANPTERYNRTLKTMLRVYISDNHRHWDVNLAKVSCAARTAFHESAGHSPYFICFGRKMVLDGTEYSIRDKLREGEEGSTDPKVFDEGRLNGFSALFKDVRERLNKVSQKSEKIYNLRRRHEELLPHEVVWRKNFVLSNAATYFSSKLAPKWVGPFYVQKKVSPWTYKLVDKHGKDQGIWNIKNLKPASANENLLE